MQWQLLPPERLKDILLPGVEKLMAMRNGSQADYSVSEVTRIVDELQRAMVETMLLVEGIANQAVAVNQLVEWFRQISETYVPPTYEIKSPENDEDAITMMMAAQRQIIATKEQFPGMLRNLCNA